MKTIILAACLTIAPFIAGCGSHDGHDMSAPDKSASDMGTFKSESMTVSNVMLRPPLPGRTTAMATLTVTNTSSADDVLLSITSPISDSVELHTVLMEDDVRKMRRLENGLALPKGETIVLKGGGNHVMIFNANVAEDAKTVPMVLTFQTAEPLNVMATLDDGSGDHSGH